MSYFWKNHRESIYCFTRSRHQRTSLESDAEWKVHVIEQFPIIINVRDRLSPLLLLLDWIHSVGQREIWLCDNASTYPPLLEFLHSTKHRVVFTETNLGHRAPWLSGLVPELGSDRYFVVTDPDVVPVAECPTDALHFFKHSLQEHPEINKVGFSLKIDDLPDWYANKKSVIAWESQFWTIPAFDFFYRAPIDTTFAMYPPGLGHGNHHLRTAPPYVARHLPWYQDSANPTEEDIYYVTHSDSRITNWNSERIPANVRAMIRNSYVDSQTQHPI